MLALVEAALDSRLLGVPRPLAMLIRDGGDGPRDTRQVFVFDAQGVPRAVARVAEAAPARALLRREHAKLTRMRVLLEKHPGSLPEPLAFEDDGRIAFLLETYLAGRRLKDLPPSHASRPELLGRLAAWLADLARLKPERAEDCGTLAARQMNRYLASFDTGAAERAFLTTLPDLLAASGVAGLELVLGHGDLSDANVLVGPSACAVIDWDEPVEGILPGADFFYMLCSVVATHRGLGSRVGFEQAFREAFFSDTPTSRLFARLWATYRTSLGLSPSAGLPLFVASWVGFALQKLDYLDASAETEGVGRERIRGLRHPQQNYPVTFFAAGSCRNVALASESAARFVLSG